MFYVFWVNEFDFHTHYLAERDTLKGTKSSDKKAGLNHFLQRVHSTIFSLFWAGLAVFTSFCVFYNHHGFCSFAVWQRGCLRNRKHGKNVKHHNREGLKTRKS